MADKRISQLVDRGTVVNNDVIPIVVSGATTTNKATISSIQTFMQGNLDLGVTSVGITFGTTGTDINASGSPVTSSGNITINLPTASAVNRGALSSADWTTFNSKQGAITLTTTGTSGVSTLVGNTLNIPNYTTDLSGYVTLGTAQTITAQKTFTTSGSSDTMIISHGSGSGFALDVIKAGNNEAIRVTKTSGSGNAMTISGGNFEAGTIVKTGGTSSQFLKADGSVDSSTYLTTGTAASTYLPLVGGTLTGGLNGTSANFSGSVGIGTNTPEGSGLTVASGGILVSLDPGAARKVLELYATSTGAKVSSSYVGASSYGSLELLTSGLARLTIADTGAATFSSSVNVIESNGSGFVKVGSSSGRSQYQNINFGGVTGGTDYGWQVGRSPQTGGVVNDGFYIYDLKTNNAPFVIALGGNVGIGTASPTTKLHVESPTGTDTVARFSRGPSNAGDVLFGIGDYGGGNQCRISGQQLAFEVNRANGAGMTSSTAMFITSGGKVGIGTLGPDGTLTINSTTTSLSVITNADASAKAGYFWHQADSGNNQLVQFFTDSGANQRGTISFNRAAGVVVYGTTSDYRLKTEVQDFNALQIICNLKPVEFRIGEAEKKSIGFIAHELQEFFPQAVHGEKDAEDENEKPIYQGVDYSQLTGLLTKAIQELKKEIDSLKNQMQ